MARDPFADDSARTDDFDGPSGRGDYKRMEDFEGELLLVTPRKEGTFKSRQFGDGPKIETDTVVLTGPLAGLVIDGQNFIGTEDSAIIDQLRKNLRTGRRLLARPVRLPNKECRNKFEITTTAELVELEAKWVKAGAKDKDKPRWFWTWEAPSDEDKQLARQYLAGATASDPFAA